MSAGMQGLGSDDLPLFLHDQKARRHRVDLHANVYIHVMLSGHVMPAGLEEMSAGMFCQQAPNVMIDSVSGHIVSAGIAMDCHVSKHVMPAVLEEGGDS